MLDFFKRLFGSGDPQGNVCGFCGKTLIGAEIYRVEDKRCCPECYRKKHPENCCADCGKTDTLYVWNGKRYCRRCYERRKLRESCRVCGCVLTGREGSNELIMTPGERIVCCDACCQEIRKRNITTMEALRYLIATRSSQRPKTVQEATRHGVMRDEEIQAERRKKGDDAVLKAQGGEPARTSGDREGARQPEQQAGNIRDMLPELEAAFVCETPHGELLKARIMAYKDAWHRHSDNKTAENEAALREAMNGLVETLDKTPLLLPVALKNESPGAGYGTLHYSKGGAAALSVTETVRVIRENRIGDLKNTMLYIPDGEGRARRLTFVKRLGDRVTPDPALWDISRFAGCDGWSFGSPLDDLGPWRGMTVEAAGRSCVALYTDIQSMKLLFSEENWPCVAVISAPEALEMIKDNRDCGGLIINPNARTHCMLNRRVFFPG